MKLPETKSILFLDLCGSTRMKFEEGENAGIEVVLKHIGIVDKSIAKYKGTIINIVGDGIFCVFKEANSALEFVTKVILECLSTNIHTKAGLHLGHVYPHPKRRNDYLGSDVDLASRLCSAAQSNSVLCSEEFHKHVDLAHRKMVKWQEITNISLKGVRPGMYFSVSIPSTLPLLTEHAVVGNCSQDDLDYVHSLSVILGSVVDDKRNTLRIGSHYFHYWVEGERLENSRLHQLLDKTKKVPIEAVVYKNAHDGDTIKADKLKLLRKRFTELARHFPERFTFKLLKEHSELTYIFYDIPHPCVPKERWQRMIVGYRSKAYKKKPFLEFVYPDAEPYIFPKIIRENHKRLMTGTT